MVSHIAHSKFQPLTHAWRQEASKMMNYIVVLLVVVWKLLVTVEGQGEDVGEMNLWRWCVIAPPTESVAGNLELCPNAALAALIQVMPYIKSNTWSSNVTAWQGWIQNSTPLPPLHPQRKRCCFCPCEYKVILLFSLYISWEGELTNNESTRVDEVSKHHLHDCLPL